VLVTVLEVSAAVLYLLEVFGVLRYLRERISPKLSCPRVEGARFFTLSRAAVLSGLFLTLALGFVDPLWARLTIAGVLALVVIGKEFVEWRQAKAQVTADEAPSSAPLNPSEAVPPAEPVQPQPSNPRAQGTDHPARPKGDTGSAPEEGHPLPRFRYRVWSGVVELRLQGVTGLGATTVTCTVIGPDGRETNARPILYEQPGILGVLGAFSPRTAIAQYPTDFDRAPPLREGALYRVVWEETNSLMFSLTPRVTHGSFRY
jgi:hypothetical protein